MYHPTVAAAYYAQQHSLNCFPLQRPPSLSVPGGDMELRQQFRLLEHQQQMQQQQQAAAYAAAQQQQQQHMAPSSVSAATACYPGTKPQEQHEAYAAQARHYHHAVLPPPAPPQPQPSLSGASQQTAADAYSAALWYKQQQALLQSLQASGEALGLLSPEQQAAVLQYGQYQQRLANAHALAQAMGHS